MLESIEKKEREFLSENEEIKTSSNSMKNIIEIVKSTYNGYDDLEEMITDLSEDSSVDWWAQKFCGENYGKNIELAKKLLELHEKSCESSRDFCDFASTISSKDILNDKVWAKKLFNKAIDLAEDNISDLCSIADGIADSSSFDDKEWAKTLYEKAIDLIEDDISDLCSIADKIADSSYLDDKEWVKTLYEKVAENLNELSEYNHLYISINRYLEDKDWANSLILEAKEALINSDDKFEFAGFSSEILTLSENIVDEDYTDDKEGAKEIFELLKDYEGVTNLLDAARKVKEIYEDENEYVVEYMNDCLDKAIDYVDDGYYCDIYYFIKDDIEDEDRAYEFKYNYIDEMQNDYEQYGSCEELFEDIDLDDYDDVRNIVRIGLSFLYNEVEEILDDDQNIEAKELANEKISEFLLELSDKLSGYFEDKKLFINLSFDEDADFESISGFDLDSFNVDFDCLNMYIVLNKKIPRDVMDRICLEMDEYDFTMESLNEDNELIYQYYSQGEYDSGFYVKGRDDYYVNAKMNSYNFAKLKLDVE